ncbi:MAG: hypothetical protein ACPL8I_14425, partial [Chloroflexaceae bacterium]
DPQNAVDVIRHNHERIQFHMGKMHGNVQPTLFGNTSGTVQLHPSFAYLPKEVRSVVSDNGNEICPDPSVIVPFQANATAVVTFGVVIHGLLSCPASSKTDMHFTENHPERLWLQNVWHDAQPDRPLRQLHRLRSQHRQRRMLVQ